MNRSKDNELQAPSLGEHGQERGDGERSRAQYPLPTFIDLTRLSDYLIAQGFVETETTYAIDDMETITYHLTDKGLKLLSKLL